MIIRKKSFQKTRSDRRVTAERRRSNGRRRMDDNAWIDSQPVFNTVEACRYLRISRPTFLKLVETGMIRAQKIGRGWKVLRSELDRFLTGG